MRVCAHVCVCVCDFDGGITGYDSDGYDGDDDDDGDDGLQVVMEVT